MEFIHPEVKRIIKMAIYELITLLTSAVLTIVKETLYFKDEEKKEIIFDALSSGDIPNKNEKKYLMRFQICIQYD